MLKIACQMGDNKTLNEASRLFDQWIMGSLRYHYSGGLSVVIYLFSEV